MVLKTWMKSKDYFLNKIRDILIVNSAHKANPFVRLSLIGFFFL